MKRPAPPIEDQLLDQYFSSYPERATSCLAECSNHDIVEIIQGLPARTIVNILNGINAAKASHVLASLPDTLFLDVYAVLDPVRSAYLLANADAEARNSKIHLLSDSEKTDFQEISRYPSDAAGSLMDTSVQTCRAGDSVKKVIADLRKSRSKSREIFVTDIEGKLVGYLPVQELLFSQDNESIESVMHKDPPSVNALSPKVEVTAIFETFKTTFLPVTHIDGSLLGGIRYASLVQQVQTQALSAMASLGGASPSERTLSPPFFSVSKRLPWLSINLVTAFIASAVVGIFEGTIAKVTALAVLLPVVAGQSGNTGAQAMAVTMRGLALREVRTRQWMKILFKEVRVGFINGLAIAIVTGASVYFWSQSVALGCVMTAAMVFSMVIASVSGAGIPIILTALGKDPAQSSSVILTTVTDVMGFLSFLGLATIFASLLIR
jgi:magnesium transporter